jgi:hypothetical protein
MLARDKHSSLLRKFVNYGRKKFYNIKPRLAYYEHLQITVVKSFVIQASLLMPENSKGANFVWKNDIGAIGRAPVACTINTL